MMQSKALLAAVLPATVLLVSAPAAADRGAAIAERIKTRVDAKGNAEAGIGGVAVSIGADGSWGVKR